MSLTDRERQAVADTLKQKGARGCPICGATSWQLQDEMVATVPSVPGGGLSIGGAHIPMIQVVCTNCGFVSHHAAAALGIQINPK